MTEVSGEERLARAALTCVAEPGDPVMGALLRTCAPAEIVTALVQGRVPAPAAGAAGPGRRRPQGPDHDRAQGPDHDRPQGPDWDGLPGLDRALRRRAGRLGEAPAAPDLDNWRRAGIRLVCPGEPGSNLPYY